MACVQKAVARARMAVVMADTTGAVIVGTEAVGNERPPVCNANVRNARMSSVKRLQA